MFPVCRRRRVTPETATKILAIAEDTRPPEYVDSTGSRRRVQALVAMGWPSLHVARRAGICPSNRTVILARPKIRRGTAQKIEAAYEEMRGRILTKDECDLTIRVNWKSCLTRGLVEEALKRSAQWDVNCSLLVRYVLYLGFESLTKVWGPSPEVEGLTVWVDKSEFPHKRKPEGKKGVDSRA